jgi:hypothetical protein
MQELKKFEIKYEYIINAEFPENAKKFKTIMNENEISEKVIGCAIEVHRILGTSLLESVYEDAM